MQAMILAAGFGTRLLPYSAHRPKPLFPLLNIPLLLLAVRQLQASGFDHIVVNCHHLGGQIKTALANCPGIVILEENEILGTGGGLRNALRFFRDEPLLIVNGDIYHSVDLSGTYDMHVAGGSSVTLALHDYPRFNSLITEGGHLVSFGAKNRPGALAFTGIHVVDPKILQPIPSRKKSSIIDRYRSLLEQNIEISVLRVDGDFWTDIGTPQDYLDLNGALLHGSVPRWSELQELELKPQFVDNQAELGKNVEMHDWCVVGKAKIGDDVVISRSVIWDGAEVASGSVVENGIIV